MSEIEIEIKLNEMLKMLEETGGIKNPAGQFAAELIQTSLEENRSFISEPLQESFDKAIRETPYGLSIIQAEREKRRPELIRRIERMIAKLKEHNISTYIEMLEFHLKNLKSDKVEDEDDYDTDFLSKLDESINEMIILKEENLRFSDILNNRIANLSNLASKLEPSIQSEIDKRIIKTLELMMRVTQLKDYPQDKLKKDLLAIKLDIDDIEEGLLKISQRRTKGFGGGRRRHRKNTRKSRKSRRSRKW